MISSYFMDVPVYRVSSERYYKEMDKFVNKEIFRNPDHIEQQKEFFRHNPDHESRFREYYQGKYGGAWNYNEIVGYIQLHFLGSQIRGEYWGLAAKRITRTRKKTFEWKTHKLAHELDIPRNASNADIYEKISAYLSICEKELNGRHIDTTRFRTIGPYVDWVSLRRNV